MNAMTAYGLIAIGAGICAALVGFGVLGPKQEAANFSQRWGGVMKIAGLLFAIAGGIILLRGS
jgi:hypothetical protein